MRTFASLSLCLLATIGAPAFAADAATGKQLHDKHCVACHVQRFGGDGSSIYTRKNRLIRDRQALTQRIGACNAMVNAGLFPEDESASE